MNGYLVMIIKISVISGFLHPQKSGFLAEEGEEEDTILSPIYCLNSGDLWRSWVQLS